MPAGEHLACARATVEAMLGCPVALPDDLDAHLASFEAAHCFGPDVQPALTAAFLSEALTRMDRRVATEVVEPLGVRVVLFWVGDAPGLIGPFTERGLRKGEAEDVLGGLRLPGSLLQRFRLYRASFAVLDSELALRGAVALLGHEAGSEAVELVRIHADTAPITPGSLDAPQSASYADIDRRYATEREFMRAVAEGDERTALAELQRMDERSNRPRYLNTPYLGATILRIMARVAAQQGGLPPVTIDAISQTYAQRLHRSRFSPESDRTLEDVGAMVSEFCLHVRRHRQRPYSHLVRAVMDQIELHLSTEVSTRELAATHHVSASHLARRFKAETGRTLGEYLKAERVERASHLLRTTAHTVRDIAAHVGYLDPNYFVKVFRGVRGMTPTEYRQRLRDDPGAVRAPTPS